MMKVIDVVRCAEKNGIIMCNFGASQVALNYDEDIPLIDQIREHVENKDNKGSCNYCH